MVGRCEVDVTGSSIKEGQSLLDIHLQQGRKMYDHFMSTSSFTDIQKNIDDWGIYSKQKRATIYAEYIFYQSLNDIEAGGPVFQPFKHHIFTEIDILNIAEAFTFLPSPKEVCSLFVEIQSDSRVKVISNTKLKYFLKGYGSHLIDRDIVDHHWNKRWATIKFPLIPWVQLLQRYPSQQNMDNFANHAEAMQMPYFTQRQIILRSNRSIKFLTENNLIKLGLSSTTITGILMEMIREYRINKEQFYVPKFIPSFLEQTMVLDRLRGAKISEAKKRQLKLVTNYVENEQAD
jgi:hypothetical protein